MTDVIQQTYVEYEFHGRYDGTTRTRDVPDRNKFREAKAIPEHGVAFRYFDVVSTKVEADGESVELTSIRLNISLLYYVDAEFLTVAQVQERQPGGIGSFMIDNGYTTAIRDRLGSIEHMFDPDAHLLISA